MAARERILAEIRKRQGRGGPLSVTEREAIDTYLRRHPRGPLREPAADLVAAFRERAEAAASTTDRVASLAEAPVAIARYLDANSLPRSGCVWPTLGRLDWRGAGLSLEARAAHADDAIGVTGVFSAIAETGTLMLCSGPDTPASVSLLPETHIAIVPVERIVPVMEDAWDLARAELGQLPRAVNFISGPSRTADIEQTIVLGAHGPYRVHLLLVG
ncbi:MAG TPA: lactate utilization protein C [Burkholderiales bacterium]|jgi:L-lactate dehydrogenase complex protein LldG|nr:lactate utilization protein C [Burkholderiales bacterium]